MVVLRADPWMPEYGMGFDVAVEELEGPPPDWRVETEDWSQGLAGGPPPRGSLWFVDGVRRIELRLLADEGDRRAPGLFGSYAAGAVCCDGQARFADHLVRRALVLGGGLSSGRVELEGMVFDAESIAETDPDAPLLHLQTLMRGAEADLAAELAGEDGRLVLADGPLAYTFYERATRSHVVGVVKRFAREYLDPAQGALLGRLAPGQRTPLFAIGDERRRRFAWYVRLTRIRPPLHDRAGLVRCEVRYAVGVAEARRLADRVTSALPLYAGRAWDPRAPQNLAPIAGLESWLRHRMGDTRLVRRMLLAWLARGEVAA